jgi:succinate dehydrogenase / fumarate reductase cytochrome b subunit
MVIHLTTNASLLNGVATFQRAVFQIHSLGNLLPVVEWTFILLPLLFHGLIGVWITMTGRSNVRNYKFTANRRYLWQRITGVIALVFLLTHVFHLHGWSHNKVWLDYVAEPLGMAQFKPYNAASTLALALEGVVWPAFYLLGVLATVFHLANGLWTAGITWGLWLTPAAQARATKVCVVFGVLLAVAGTGAWWAAITTDPAQAIEIEDQMYNEARAAKMVPDAPEKRLKPALIAPQPDASADQEGRAADASAAEQAEVDAAEPMAESGAG